MSGWTLIETRATHGRMFQRPLDPHEFAFALFGRSSGSGDILYHAELRLLNHSRDVDLFSEANIVKAWLSTKRRFPLAGAAVRVLPEDASIVRASGGYGFPSFASDLCFVVQEHDLAALRPHEIVFVEVPNAEEVPKRMSAICDGPRPLSDELLIQLYVFRETDSERKDVIHLVPFIAHCVVDGTARQTFLRCLLDTLARGGGPDGELAQVPLEERLAMAIPSADLVPMHVRSLNVARRRWRGAIGFVIAQLRTEKGQGGHTFPRRRTRETARSSVFSTRFTEAQTTTVLANCRLHGLTFGNAYLTLTQVAMTRVLYRRYLRGEISEEEWAYRKQQPHRISGPLNMRPYLDKPWYEGGGGGEFKFCVSRFFYQLPFMTLGGVESRQYHDYDPPDGALPPFSDFLTFDRFSHRAGLIKKQAKKFFGDPLFLELAHARRLTLGRIARQMAKLPESPHVSGTLECSSKFEQDEILPATSMPSVFAYEVSTLGSLDLTLPSEYPLPSTHPLSPFSPVPHPSRVGYVSPSPATEVEAAVTPKIVVENNTTLLHVYPGELYLNSFTLRGQLEMYCSYDGYVYEEEMIKEWVSEVKEAVLWYLGQTHRSRYDQG